MTGRASTRATRERRAPETRRGQIVAAAADMVLEEGHLPLPPERLAERAGVSKGLVYAYFPNQIELFNAILTNEFGALVENGLEAASLRPTLSEAALDCARVYFSHVAAGGPVIHLILRDPLMTSRLDPALAVMRDRIIRRLARLVRRELRLPADDAVAAISMATTIPEECGRLAFAGELSVDRARALCEQLIQSTLDAFRPRLAGPPAPRGRGA